MPTTDIGDQSQSLLTFSSHIYWFEPYYWPNDIVISLIQNNDTTPCGIKMRFQPWRE